MAQLMFEALVKGKADFVKLLLENGFDLRRFVTEEMLVKLYKEVIHFNQCANRSLKMFAHTPYCFKHAFHINNTVKLSIIISYQSFGLPENIDQICLYQPIVYFDLQN